LFERRGYQIDEIRVIAALENGRRLLPFALTRLGALSTMRDSDAFRSLGALFKRVKNITKNVDARLGQTGPLEALRGPLREPAALALVDEFASRWPLMEAAIRQDRLSEAMQQLAGLYPAVDRFFTDVLVMVEDPTLRDGRLKLLTHLRNVVLQHIGDISEIASEEKAA